MPELNITYNNNRIQKVHITEYRGCYLDAILSGESIAVKYLKRIITQLQFFYRQNKFLNPKLHRLLCNSAVQPLCLCMYFLVPLVSQKIRKKNRLLKNKCIHLCLKLNSRHHIGAKGSEEMNWLPTKERAEQSVATKYF